MADTSFVEVLDIWYFHFILLGAGVGETREKWLFSELFHAGFPDLTRSRDRTSYQTIGEQEPHRPPSTSSEAKITVPGY